MAYVNSSTLIADFQSQSDTGGHSGFYAEREKEALPADPSPCFPTDRSCQASELSAIHVSLPSTQMWFVLQNSAKASSL